MRRHIWGGLNRLWRLGRGSGANSVATSPPQDGGRASTRINRDTKRRRRGWLDARTLTAAVVSAGLSLGLFGPLHSPSAAGAGEIGFIEDFALAPDRNVPLKQLIPGTEDYYYFNSLHLLNTQQYEKVVQFTKPWLERHGRTPRLGEIEMRHALLTYEQNPQKTIEFLRSRLGLNFNHQREVLGQAPNLPTALDPALIARQNLLQRAYQRSGNLDPVEDSALEWLTAAELTPERRRHLLQRLTRPDFANLPKLVADDLNHPNSPGFGAFGIHRQMLRSQLDELLKLKPELLNQGNFVTAYLAKLQPAADDDWRRDPALMEKYLDSLKAFVDRLAPVHNSLKAHIAYHRLVLDRNRGKLDKQRFLDYLKLPRPLPYVAPALLQADGNRQFHVDVNADYRGATLLAPVGNDEPVVRAYLQALLLDATNTEEFTPYIHDVYLKHLFAEVKIVNGLGEPEQWASQLPPELFQQLKARVDLDFAPTNSSNFATDEPVRLDLFVKNVSTLIVKVFEINTPNYYRQQLREIDTDVNLDGLVANVEQTHNYAEAPLRRVQRRFEFPQLSKSGVYIIDFIGNGRSSRALIRKGKLRYVATTGTAGHVVRVYDEKNQPAPDATVWLGGRDYAAEKDGAVRIPFSTAPGRVPIVLTRGEFACFDSFQHDGESYTLNAGFYVDREALLTRKKAELLIRPSLLLNGQPVSLNLLEEARLQVQSSDQDGVATTQDLGGVKPLEDRELVHTFQVPARLAGLSFQLRGKVRSLTLDRKIDVAVGDQFVLNQIDRTDKIEDIHLAQFAGAWVLELRGKTGEPKPARPLQIRLKHRDFKELIVTVLKTDERGRVLLGNLPGIVSISAQGPEGTQHAWPLRQDRHTYASALHGSAGQPLKTPYLGKAEKPSRDELALFEMRGDTYLADRFENLALNAGFVELRNLPAGDYELVLKDEGRRIAVRVIPGEKQNGFVLGRLRQAEVPPIEPVQVESVKTDDKKLVIQLRQASKLSRVHLFVTRFAPAFDAYDRLGRVRAGGLSVYTPGSAESQYVVGRNIGDEYRYIIDRRYAPKFPGNSLDRPGLLLNPWAVRSTETGVQLATKGDEFFGADRGRESAKMLAEGGGATAGGQGDFANLDFLASASAVLVNLLPDENGQIKVDLEALKGQSFVHVVAVDPIHTTSRTISLPEPTTTLVDLRLADGLDPKTHFTQQKQVTVVRGGETFTLSDIATSRFEAYDTLESVHRVLATLSGDATWSEFRFVLEWPKLKPEEKRAQYSKYASHELNFFLMRRDPEFFQAVVKPYLANKKDMTFLDRWLLGTGLDDQRQPWNHGRLNVVERSLLGRRIAAERPAAARHVREQFELLPPDMNRYLTLFETAVKGSVLETDREGKLNLNFAKDQVETLQRKMLRDEAPKSEAASAAPPAPAAANRPAAPGAPSGGPAGPGEPKGSMGGLGGLGGGFGGGGGGMGRAGAAGNRSREAADGAARRGLAADAKKAEAMDKAKFDARFKQGAIREEERLAERQMQEKRAGKPVDMNANGVLGEIDALYMDDRGVEQTRRLYRKLEATQEWAENNYYHRSIHDQNANLITVNSLWRDYAEADPAQPFLSRNFADASRNFHEMMFLLGVLDLPYEAGKHDVAFEGVKMSLKAASPMVVFHEELKPARPAAAGTPILVSQNFFRANDRYREENGERSDKFVKEEFLTHVVYGCQVVVTNPTSARQKLNVLLQIPRGAMAVANGQATRTQFVTLEPYNAQTIEYFFYFPAAGQFIHYPVHVAKNEELIASAQPFEFKVVDEPTKVDTESWEHVSQNGSPADVIAFLNKANLGRINLEKIAFRMKDKAFFEQVIGLLAERHVYHPTLWSYGFVHQATGAMGEFLKHQDAIANICGGRLQSPLLTIDPVVRHMYEHLEYKPLVNARAHTLGARRQIVNQRLYDQYHSLLRQLSYSRQLNDDDLLAVTYYLLLQDRIEEALATFGKVNVDRVTTRLQYDYLAAYVDFFSDQPKKARAIAAKYADHPVDRWRNTFAAVLAQLDEIEGKAPPAAIDPEDRQQQQTKLAATEPNFEFTVEAQQLKVTYQNLKSIRVNYYLMDVELLFSRNPFVQQFSGEFSSIRPNQSAEIKLADDKAPITIPLPEALKNKNVLVELVAAGKTRTQAYYAHSLNVQLVENYGQLRVTHAQTQKPVAKAYVKVYARANDGSVKFYKDGYTDLRGRFDYTSLNTGEIDQTNRFSLLIMSEEFGSLVREANPPRQ